MFTFEEMNPSGNALEAVAKIVRPGLSKMTASCGLGESPSIWSDDM